MRTCERQTRGDELPDYDIQHQSDEVADQDPRQLHDL